MNDDVLMEARFEVFIKATKEVKGRIADLIHKEIHYMYGIDEVRRLFPFCSEYCDSMVDYAIKLLEEN